MPVDPAIAIRDAITELAKGSLASLVSSEPMTSTPELEHNTSGPISPAKHHTDALSIVPRTWNEHLLHTVLQEAFAREQYLKQQLIDLQATSILNETYCSRLRGQLAHQEVKKAGAQHKGKLMGDGLPVLLTGDVFYERVVNAEATRGQEARDKGKRQEERLEQTELLVEWKWQQELCKEVIAT